jgi:hypothetical protein
MPSVSPFDSTGSWYKGNLHTHTTQSDGKLTPAESMRWHAEHGYHFLAITDHNVLTQPKKFLAEPPLLAIPSVEVTARRGPVEYHLPCIGVSELPAVYDTDPQEVIQRANQLGGLAFIAHPYWHDLTLDDLLTLHGHVGIEIFNTGCWLETQKGLSLVHLDGVLRRGQRTWGLAVDDSHFAYPDHGRGWIMLRSERLDQASVLESLRKGRFYASMGPEIYDVQKEGRKITVHCSPAQSVYLVGDYFYSPMAAQAWDGKPITTATFELVPNQKYFRVEVVDQKFQSAWTNAYFISDYTF